MNDVKNVGETRRDSDYEPEHFFCSECKHYNISIHSCKRLKNGKLKHYAPWFKNGYNSGCVCNAFELKDYMKSSRQNWIDFPTYWSEYVENWLPYSDTDKLKYFFIGDDDKVAYGVKLLDYVFNNMYDENGNLKAVEKMYHKQSRKSPFGYTLVREKIYGGIQL